MGLWNLIKWGVHDKSCSWLVRIYLALMLLVVMMGIVYFIAMELRP